MNIETALQVDLVDTVRKAGGNPKQYYGSDYRCACPIHRGENANNFTIYNQGDKWRWKCFSRDCGQGDVIDFIMAYKGFDLKRAVEYLGGGADITPDEIKALAAERVRKAEEFEQQKKDEYLNALEELQQAKAWQEYYQNLDKFEVARELWAARDIPDVFQSIWELGYCDKFAYSTSQGKMVTPTLTIPIFGPGRELLNIRHRLLNPFNPGDKYRPHRAGLRSVPFLADPDRGYDFDHILVVEGEIKAAVAYLTIDSTNLQVVGIPGKTQFRSIIDKLKGKNVVILFDPDAGKEAVEAAKLVKGRVVHLKIKVDDAINAGQLDQATLKRILNSSRRY